MNKSFSALFKTFSKSAQSDPSLTSLDPEPGAAWNSRSESPSRWGLRARERSFASLSSATLRSSSRRRGTSKHRQSVVSSDEQIPDLPPLDPSVFFNVSNDLSKPVSAHGAKSSFSTKGPSFDSSVGGSPRPVNTPHSSFTTEATPPPLTTPTSSKFSARHSSRSGFEAPIGQTPSRAKPRHDSHAFNSPNHLDIPLDKLLAAEGLDLDAAISPMFDNDQNELPLPIAKRVSASTTRTAHDRVTSAESLRHRAISSSTSPNIRKISDEQKVRDSEDSTVPTFRTTPTSARSSTVSQKRKSRQRQFTNGNRPAPLILSASYSPPSSGPPSYPPPPNPLERMETRVQKLEEQLYLLNMRVATLLAAQQEGKAMQSTE